MKNKNEDFILILTLVLAFILRIAGLNHGFPFIFHPDEPTVIRTALSIRFFPNPGHFDWPHLYMYLNYFLYMGFGVFRKLLIDLDLKRYIDTYAPIIWNDELIYYLLTRLFSATLGVLTVIPLFLAGKNTFSNRVGLISAVVLAITPFHVWHSHYALIDVPMLFFATWGVLFTLGILRKGDTNDFIAAGFYFGLAASTKYNGGLLTFTIVLAYVLRAIRIREKFPNFKSLGNLALSAFGSVIGFLIGTPYALLDFQTFTRTDGPKGALWQFTNVGALPLNERFGEFLREMTVKVADDFGYTILAGFFMLGFYIIYRIVRKTITDQDYTLWFLFISGLSMLIYIAGFKFSRSHYYFVAYPFVILAFAYMFDLFLTKINEGNSILGFLLFVLLIGPPLILSIKNSIIFYRSDTRVAVYNWLKTHASPGETISFNKSAIRPILDNVGGQKIKFNNGPSIPRGLFVLAYDEDCNCTDFPYFAHKNQLTVVAEAGNEYRLGPKITVYNVR